MKGVSIFAFLVLLSGCSECNHWEIISTYYPSYELDKVDVNSREWLPADMPISAADIYVKYDLDTNRVWVNYKASHDEILSMKGRLEKVSAVRQRFEESLPCFPGAEVKIDGMEFYTSNEGYYMIGDGNVFFLRD